MKTLNLGILAHVDAGKTSLTERLLYEAGVITKIGSVDTGTTQTDTLALERQRGITIKSAVASFVANGVNVNLIDTPGHPDFIAEVERVLNVLDGVVLVISAVEGVQAQTRILLRTLQRLELPTLIFVNKIDRLGARYDDLLADIASKLTPDIFPMGTVTNIGNRDADFVMRQQGNLAGLAVQVKQSRVHPVFFGSAITGSGLEAIFQATTELLPTAESNTDGLASGSVFKIERGKAGEKIAYIRVFSGTLHVRDTLSFNQGKIGRVTTLSVFDRGSVSRRSQVQAGGIAKVRGLSDVLVGDSFGAVPRARSHHFAPPTLETAVIPTNAADKTKLYTALAQLAEQDPLINVRQDPVQHELYVSLYGEVQKEVIHDTLSNDYGISVDFRETTTIYVERPVGVGYAIDEADTPSNLFEATIGLKIEPLPAGSGVQFKMDVPPATTPPMPSFQQAVEEAIRKTLSQGLYGWKVIDCLVTMTDSFRFRHHASTTPSDFRNLAPLTIMAALKDAGTVVCEPVHQFDLTIPTHALGKLSATLVKLQGITSSTEQDDTTCTLHGQIPAAHVHELQQQLPGLTSGEGVLSSEFSHYEPVRGAIPTVPRIDYNPLDRQEYLRRVARGE